MSGKKRIPLSKKGSRRILWVNNCLLRLLRWWRFGVKEGIQYGAREGVRDHQFKLIASNQQTFARQFLHHG
jgi:hypothetical protein